MAKTYHCELEVRGYELDSFGHVNHAVYISYLEHARWKLLEEEQITLAKFQAWKAWPVIAELEAKYLRPTFLGDRLDVRTHIVEHGKTHFAFSQKIHRGATTVFEGRVRAVMVNERGRPCAIPPEVEKLWSDRDHGGGI
jgi:YbgC/YbaW family acyl-CoA thioester hydrolase